MAKKKKGYDELGEGVLNYLGAYGSPASSAGALQGCLQIRL